MHTKSPDVQKLVRGTEAAPGKFCPRLEMATTEDQEELLLSCRYGELDEVQQFADKFGATSLGDVKDDNGNNVLHMVCANGHEGMGSPECIGQTTLNPQRRSDVLDYLLSVVSPSLLSASNQAGSTPLHWATLNSHLPIVKKLVLFPRGPGAALIDMKNNAGRSPLGVAEFAGWEEGAQWLVEKMSLDQGPGSSQEDDVEAGELEPEVGDIEVEIQDAEGGVSKMTLGGKDAKVRKDV